MTASFTLFLVAIFIVAVWWGWEWPYIAKLMPVYIAAIPGLVLGVTQLIGEASGSEARQSGVGREDRVAPHAGLFRLVHRRRCGHLASRHRDHAAAPGLSIHAGGGKGKTRSLRHHGHLRLRDDLGTF